jgi:hypothetical protein
MYFKVVGLLCFLAVIGYSEACVSTRDLNLKWSVLSIPFGDFEWSLDTFLILDFVVMSDFSRRFSVKILEFSRTA